MIGTLNRLVVALPLCKSCNRLSAVNTAPSLHWLVIPHNGTRSSAAGLLSALDPRFVHRVGKSVLRRCIRGAHIPRESLHYNASAAAAGIGALATEDMALPACTRFVAWLHQASYPAMTWMV